MAVTIVADTGNNRVQVLRLDGSPDFAFGSFGSGAGNFSSPKFVAVANGSGIIAVADQGNYRIQMFYPNGTFVREFGRLGSLDGQFGTIAGIAWSPSGDRLAVASSNAIGTIQFFYPNGTFQDKMLPAQPGIRFFPLTSITYDPSGDRVVVGETYYNCLVSISVVNPIIVYPPNPSFSFPPVQVSSDIRQFACSSPHHYWVGDGYIGRPAAVAYSPSGDRLAAADTMRNSIQVLRHPGDSFVVNIGAQSNPTPGNASSWVVAPSDANGEFSLPRSVAYHPLR